MTENIKEINLHLPVLKLKGSLVIENKDFIECTTLLTDKVKALQNTAISTDEGKDDVDAYVASLKAIEGRTEAIKEDILKRSAEEIIEAVDKLSTEARATRLNLEKKLKVYKSNRVEIFYNETLALRADYVGSFAFETVAKGKRSEGSIKKAFNDYIDKILQIEAEQKHKIESVTEALFIDDEHARTLLFEQDWNVNGAIAVYKLRLKEAEERKIRIEKERKEKEEALEQARIEREKAEQEQIAAERAFRLKQLEEAAALAEQKEAEQKEEKRQAEMDAAIETHKEGMAATERLARKKATMVDDFNKRTGDYAQEDKGERDMTPEECESVFDKFNNSSAEELRLPKAREVTLAICDALKARLEKIDVYDVEIKVSFVSKDDTTENKVKKGLTTLLNK